jgi:hypothetical protein
MVTMVKHSGLEHTNIRQSKLPFVLIRLRLEREHGLLYTLGLSNAL